VRRFDAYMEADGLVGGSMLLVRDDAVIARHHRGWADRAAGTPIDDRTLFHYGSITKTLTAIAIMQLRDRGLLDLDDPVTRWVPELRRVHDPFARIDSITVRMLLSHSAGFQDPTWPYRDQPWQPFEPTGWEQLVAMMPYQQLHFAPGSRYGYSNPGFIYLARIIEQLTGDPWQSYIQKNLFMPLGLERSYFGVTPTHLAAHRSHNYDILAAGGRDSVIDNGTDFDPGVTIPNGGWNAPLDDLARFLSFLVGAPESRARYEQVLQRRSLEEMWQPVVPVDERDAMGLSIFRHDGPDGRPILGHTGSQAGFRAYLYFSAATRTGAVIVFNTAREPTRAAAERTALLAAVDAVIATIDRSTIK
jgi:CubicO group peptidase (beta-lactamase class C family)